MENFSYHVPFYIVNGGVATSGHSADLTPGKVGIFDRKTFSVATSVGNGSEFYFAQGRIGGLDWYGEKVTESHKSPFFFGKDVVDMYYVDPKRIQNEEWVLGFNGAASSKSLQFKSGKPLRFKVQFDGDPAYRFFGGPKEYVVSYTPSTGCVNSDCVDDCGTPILDPLVPTQELIDKINKHTELRKFGVRAQLKSSSFSATTANMEKFQLTLCDEGNSVALQKVQSQYPDKAITRVSRLGTTSVYEFCQANGTDPSNFTQSGSVSLAVCGTCTNLAGSTLVLGYDTFLVSRPLAGTEDLTTDNARLTYANTIETAYASKIFDGATAVDPATNQITLPSHGYVVGQSLIYRNGGGTSIVGLTSGNTYYVQSVPNANNITLSATQGGAVVDITADGVGANHSLTAGSGAKFIANTGATALVQISVPVGVVPTALLSDTIEFSHTVESLCTLPAPSSIAWVASGTGISSTRTLKIEGLNRLDCNAGNRVADLTAILSAVPGIQINTLTVIAGTACADDYTVVQSSNDCYSEGCLTSNVTFTYQDLPAFEGRSWVVVPPVITPDNTRKTGIVITAGYVDIQFGNCSFDPSDYYEVMPVKMQISLLVEDYGACDNQNLPTITQTRFGQISRASGEYVLREATSKLDAYQKDQDQFSLNPRMREAFDMNILQQVDRKAFYKLYYVSYRASYGTNTTFRKGEQEKFTTVFAVKESDPIADTFESQILSVLTAKSGKVLRTGEGE